MDDEFIKKLKKEMKQESPIVLDEYLVNAEIFYNKQPYFYDNNQIFWMWNKTECKWEIKDDIDIMNKFEKLMGLEGRTITKGIKSNYMEAFKRCGRNKAPQPAPTRWIQFKDQAFSLRSGMIHQVTPDYFFTNPIPHEIGKNSNCPIIDKLFIDWVGEEHKQSLYEILAYCCYQSYPIQTLFCFMGGGRNGKTQYLKLIERFLGKNNITCTELDRLFGIQSSRFESFKLYKKLACLMGETNFGLLNQSSMLKKLTGGDMIGYEMKNKSPFDDYNYAKIIIASNSLPSSADTSEGFYRRWMIINFPNEFQEGKDIIDTIPSDEYITLAKKVTEILPILLENGSFTSQGSIDDRKEKYIMASNPLPNFMEEYCDNEYGVFIRYSELYTAYAMYLNNMKKRVVSKKEFGDMLEQEGIETRKTSKQIEGIWVSDKYIEGYDLNDKFRDFRDKCATFPYSPTTPLKLRVKIGTKVMKVTKNEDLEVSEDTINDSSILSFDIKVLVHQPCGYPIGDSICGENPCNEYDGLYYCEEHFKKIQQEKDKKGDIYEIEYRLKQT